MLIRYQRNINFDNLTISDTQFCPEHIWGFCRFPSVLGHFVRIYSTYHTVGEDQLLCTRNFLHRYSLTFDTARGSPTTVRMPCPADLLTSLKKAMARFGIEL